MTQNNAQHELVKDQGIPVLGDGALEQIDSLLGEAPEPEPEVFNNDSVGNDTTNTDVPSDSDNDISADSEAAEVDQEPEQNENETDIDYTQEIEVPMPYGMEKMSLSEMKDKVSNLHQETKKLQEQENALMIQRQEIEAITNAMGGMTPEIQQSLKQHHQAKLVRENRLMLDAIPDWNDPAKFNQDRETMTTLIQQYGFTNDEFAGVSDHRLVKMIRDYSTLKLQLEKADPKKVKATHKTKQARSKPATRKRAQTNFSDAAKSNNPQVKQAAIAQLLGE